MNRIVRENYPTARLPDDLREGLASSAVTVTIDASNDAPKPKPTIAEIFARRRPPFRSKEDIDADLRRLRDEAE